MITVIPFNDLGRFENDWLDAHYHFSFAEYRDPERMGLGPLRVWNDDTIRPRSGFPPHSHRDMEIITYVRTGAISHTDNLGNRGVTRAGDVQVMSAGTGIEHAEMNEEDEATTLFQIWIKTDRKYLCIFAIWFINLEYCLLIRLVCLSLWLAISTSVEQVKHR